MHRSRLSVETDGFLQRIGLFLESNAEMRKIMSGSALKSSFDPTLDAAMSFEGLYTCKPWGGGVPPDGESDAPPLT